MKARTQSRKVVVLKGLSSVVLVLGCAGCSDSRDADRPGFDSPQTASIYQLIATPERFHDTEILTYGYLILGERVQGLCPNKFMLNQIECVHLIGKDVPWDTIGHRPALIVGKFRVDPDGIYAGVMESARGTSALEFYGVDGERPANVED